jgi:DNA polymerase-3 subunit gamma/tau
MEGRHPDVIEMDAASHTGIDDIRDIIDGVRYAPVAARYKVYIIDEVHMLSTQAFNGLLKTLEEPPPHVKFIFATTEIRKVPITVLSRCQRFDLRRIDAGVIKNDLKRIAALESISVDDEALALIARAAEGSMRDAQSIFDQAIAHGAGTVAAAAVRDMLGLADRARVVDLFEHVMKGDAGAALAELRAQYDTGADPAAALTDLAEFVHLVTRFRFVPSAAEDTSLTETERKRGLDFAEKLSVRVLSRAWQMLLKGIPEVQTSNRPVSAAEMVLIRLAHAANLPTLDEALNSLDGATRGASIQARSNGSPATGASGASASPPSAVSRSAMSGASAGAAPAMRLVEVTPEPKAYVAPQPEPSTPDIVLGSLADIAALAEQHRDRLFKVNLKNHVRLVRIDPGHIQVSLTETAPKTLLGDLTTRLKNWTGRGWLVSVSKDAGGQTLAETETAKRENAILDARNDPAVAAVLARFPGAKIIDVRIPDSPEAAETDQHADLPPEPPADDDDEI